MSTQYKELKDVKSYYELCEQNYNEIYKKYYHFWEEDNISDMLAYCFQDERIFRYFLSSVFTENVYCGQKKDKIRVDSLEYKKYHFPKVRVLTQTNEEIKKKIDVLIEGKNFICAIEVKFGSKEHGEQCREYKNEIVNLCKLCRKKYHICIFLDAEHSSNSVKENQFLKEDKYDGYYLAWFGKNVLPTLKYACNKLDLNKDFGEDIRIFCNFLQEAEFGGNNNIELQKNIQSKKENLIRILDDIKKGKSLQRKTIYNDIYIGGTKKEHLFLRKHEYLGLSLIEDNAIIKKELLKRLDEHENKLKNL